MGLSYVRKSIKDTQKAQERIKYYSQNYKQYLSIIKEELYSFLNRYPDAYGKSNFEFNLTGIFGDYSSEIHLSRDVDNTENNGYELSFLVNNSLLVSFEEKEVDFALKCNYISNYDIGYFISQYFNIFRKRLSKCWNYDFDIRDSLDNTVSFTEIVSYFN